MPLNLTKVAFGSPSLAILQERLASRGTDRVLLTTRYRPKREAEMAGGSLYWIIAHHLVARSPILAFSEAEGGRTHIEIAAQAIPVLPRPRRAHQGWRYLDEADAPADLGARGDGTDALPPDLQGELAAIGLI